MKHLDENWLTTGDLDLETKQYQLFAYLQHVSKNFEADKLYPHLEELKNQKDVLSTFLFQFKHFQETAEQELSGMDISTHKLLYTSALAQTNTSKTLEEIATFALPYIDQNFKYASIKSDEYLATIDFEPIGVLPSYVKEGYAFLYLDALSQVDIFKYSIRHVQFDAVAPLEISFLGRKVMRLSESFSNLKLELTRNFRDLPNPAAFLLRPMRMLPTQETLLPLFKKRLFQGVCEFS
ncbi:MAG: hypothetical protein NWR73_08345 [Flavobacteriales bacterium]|nr:hypothetical protein [Flavobacteriales bacterium]